MKAAFFIDCWAKRRTKKRLFVALKMIDIPFVPKEGSGLYVNSNGFVTVTTSFWEVDNNQAHICGKVIRPWIKSQKDVEEWQKEFSEAGYTVDTKYSSKFPSRPMSSKRHN